MVAPVPMEDVSKYGVVDIFNQSIQEGDHMEITAVVEKPSIESAPSNLSVVGRYVLSNRIWKMLELTPVGAGNEIQLSDAIDLLLEQRTVEAYHMVGESHDCGDKLGYMKAFVKYGMRHEQQGKDFKQFLSDLK